MNSQEILKYCVEKGLLVDKEVLVLLSETTDSDSAKLIISKIKEQTSQRIITKNIFEKNQVNKIFLNLPEDKQKGFEKLKIKLGLSIEISKEISSNSINNSFVLKNSNKNFSLENNKNNSSEKNNIYSSDLSFSELFSK